MRFSIQDEIFERYSSLMVGVVLVRETNNGDSPPGVNDLLRGIQAAVRNQGEGRSLDDLPKIQAWRQAYRQFGAKPKKHRSSVESLYRMVLEGKDLRPINTLVDLYNSASLKHLLPLGGDDLDRVAGDITLRFARGDETFRPLNTETVEHPKPGEVVYADERDVLCRRWNWREADKSKMTPASTNVLMVAEGLPPATRAELEECLDDLEAWVRTFCGGSISRFLLDRLRTSIEL